MMNRVPSTENASGFPYEWRFLRVTSKAPAGVRIAGRAGVLFSVIHGGTTHRTFHGQRESAACVLAGASRGRARLDVTGPQGWP